MILKEFLPIYIVVIIIIIIFFLHFRLMREIHGVNSFAIGVHLNLMNSIISGNYV